MQEFIHAWFQGLTHGPDKVAGTMDNLVVDDVVFVPDGVVHRTGTKVCVWNHYSAYGQH